MFNPTPLNIWIIYCIRISSRIFKPRHAKWSEVRCHSDDRGSQKKEMIYTEVWISLYSFLWTYCLELLMKRVGKILLTFKSFFRGLWNRAEKMMPQQLPAGPSLCNLALKMFKKVSQRKRKFQLKSYLFAVEIGVSPEGRSRASERKHWQRHWNGDIHAHLKRTNVHQVLITAQPTESPYRSTKTTETNFIFSLDFRFCLVWFF